MMTWRANLREEIRAIARPEPAPPEILSLDANESPYGLDEQVLRELGQHLARVSLNRFPDPHALTLRQLLAQQLGVTADRLLVASSVQELVRWLCSAFSKLKPMERRPRIAYPVPAPEHYRSAVLSQGGRPLEMPLREDFNLDLVAMERHLTGGHPNLLLLSWPNDPTGALWSREELTTIVAQHTDLVIAIDESFYDYSQQTLIDLLPHHDHLVILRSLSFSGLAGLGVSYLVADAELVAEVNKVRPEHHLSALSQEAAAWLLTHQLPALTAHAREIVAERERLRQALEQLGELQVYPSEGNFLLVRVPNGPATWRALRERGVAVANVSSEGPLANCLRITVGLPAQSDQLLQALPEALTSPAKEAPTGTPHKATELTSEQQGHRGDSGLPKLL